MEYVGDTIEQCKDILRREWGDCIDDIMREVANCEVKEMTATDFLKECCCCGGNWNGMYLSGIKVLYPDVYKYIPDKLGKDGNTSFFNVINILRILKIDTSK